MISIKKLLSLESDELSSSLLRVILLLLETTALHAVEYDQAESFAFRSSIRGMREQFEQCESGPDLMLLAGGAIKLIENYNRGIERFIRNHGSEMHSIVSLMSDALVKISSGNQLAAQSLRAIEKNLEKSSQIDDIRALKGKLSESLEVICKEAVRQEAQSLELTAQLALLSAAKQVAAEAQSVASSVDSITGLPGLKAAEERLREVIINGKNCYAFVLLLERLDTINTRFGFQIGDQILASFSRTTLQRLASGDQLFRWRGPCFVAILERSTGLDLVRSEVSKIATSRLEHAVETGGRSILLNVSRAWTLIPISKNSESETITKKIDLFATEQTRLTAAAR